MARIVKKTIMSMKDLTEIARSFRSLMSSVNSLINAFDEIDGWSSRCKHRIKKTDSFDGEVFLLCKLQPDDHPVKRIEGTFKLFVECELAGCPLGK